MASPSSQSSCQRAREYTPEEWEAIREPFTQLYQSPQAPKLTLSSIQVIMREKHGFDATLRQYKRKVKLWNLERNIKADDSKFMVQKEAQRKQEGKKTKFVVNGREVTEAKFARIRRKLLRSTSPTNPYWSTPMNIRYFTPRDHTNNHSQQRRQSQSHNATFTGHHTHLVECFLCQASIYGAEPTIVQSFQEHISSTHQGYSVLRCLDGHDASRVPGVVRTTHQLPSNQVGYVHGIRSDSFDPVRLGRLCHVEDQGGGGKRPYLTLTHASSCLTLRGDARQDAELDNMVPSTQVSPHIMDASLDYGSTDWNLSPFAYNNNYDEQMDAYLNHLPMTQNEYVALDEWYVEDEYKEHHSANGFYYT